jgi:hypothetical protein
MKATAHKKKCSDPVCFCGILTTYFEERSMNIAAMPPRTLNAQILLLFGLILAGSAATSLMLLTKKRLQ